MTMPKRGRGTQKPTAIGFETGQVVTRTRPRIKPKKCAHGCQTMYKAHHNRQNSAIIAGWPSVHPVCMVCARDV
jgi:hypothetical protein